MIERMQGRGIRLRESDFDHRFRGGSGGPEREKEEIFPQAKREASIHRRAREEIGELWGLEVMQLVGQSQKVLEEQAAKKKERGRAP